MEKQQVSILLVFGLNQLVLEPTIYVTDGERVSHFTTDPVSLYKCADLRWYHTLQVKFDLLV